MVVLDLIFFIMATTAIIKEFSLEHIEEKERFLISKQRKHLKITVKYPYLSQNEFPIFKSRLKSSPGSKNQINRIKYMKIVKKGIFYFNDLLPH